ncbi:hypothetical protein [Micromonospora sp. CPCC 206061]|uniref:hypothetical protein n=1 Tax=Micromonospora sp. CPCC 206061 TaxID=3122410 RepID=UPI002FF29609
MSWERSGIPGGYTGTDWHRHDVATMWQAVQDQHTDNHWKLVSGWRRTAELTSTHLSRLEQYRANLIAAWPPDRNAAAAAYVSRLDFLIQNVRTTHEVAVANYTTFGATVGALAGAQRELKPLYDEYLRTRQAIRDHETMMAHNGASEAVSTVWRPPATQRDIEVLNNRARAIMFSLSQTIIEAEAALKHPPTYPSQIPRENLDPDIYGPSTTQSVGRHRPSVTAATWDFSSPSPAAQSVNNRPAAGSMRTRPRTEPTPTRATNSTLPAPGLGRSQPTTPGATRRSHLDDTQTATRRGLPAGEIIGAVRSVTNSPAPRRPPSRVNPIGGVIGETPTPPPPGMLAVSRPTDPTAGEKHRRRGINDEPWDVAEGVPPVLQPSKRRDLTDPGPAIGLWR